MILSYCFSCSSIHSTIQCVSTQMACLTSTRELILVNCNAVSSSRAAHSVLCCGRHQWVVLSALAGDPPQSLHLPAEQSPKTGGNLRTNWEGLLIEKLTCVYVVSVPKASLPVIFPELVILVMLVQPSDISLWNAVSMASERQFFFIWLHTAFTLCTRFHTNHFLIDFCAFAEKSDWA